MKLITKWKLVKKSWESSYCSSSRVPVFWNTLFQKPLCYFSTGHRTRVRREILLTGGKMKSLIIASLILFSATLHAQTIGGLTYGGTGCPKGSLRYSFAPNEHELVLNYSKFLVRSGTGSSKALDRKACAIAVPIRVPSGYQMALATQSVGRASVRQNGRATLNMETFYAGSSGRKNSKVYGAGQHAVSIEDSANTLAWSPCGQTTNLRMNLSAVTQRDASLTLRQMSFQLFFRRCSVAN